VARRHVIFGIAAASALALDQLTKLLARAWLTERHVVDFIPGFWSWYLSYNRGMSFGFLRDTPGARFLLVAVALAACVAIVIILWRKTTNARGWLAAGLGLVFGGALGNAIDRLFAGEVTDFILWRIGDLYTHNPFNVADAALVIGVFVLLIDPGKKKDKPTA